MASAKADGGHINLRALQLANEQRSTYGLRYNDFTRYRKHCANRTHRLRSSLKTTHGRGKEFKKLPALKTETIKDGNLELLLYEAERAWAYSQELSASALKLQNSPDDDSGSPHTLRHAATSRFRRAVHWATELLSHAQALFASGRMSATGLAEATVYTLLLNGRFLRHRADYEDALHQLAVARGLLDELAGAARSTKQQALYALWGDEVGPEIRHCAHELGAQKAYDVEGLVAHFGAKHRAGLVEGYDALVKGVKEDGQGNEVAKGQKGMAGGELQPLFWEDEPVPVRNPELVDVLLKVQKAQSKLRADQGQTQGDKTKKSAPGSGVAGKKGVAAYDAILLALSDAEDVARKLAEAQKVASATTAPSQAGTRDLQFVHGFVVYQLLSRRIERDLLLVNALVSQSKTSSPSLGAGQKDKKASSSKVPSTTQVDARLYPALVKLLDSILQSLDQMRILPLVDESPELAGAVDVRVSYTRARRAMYLARAYAHPSTKKWAEALALERAGQLHIREARSVLSTLDAATSTLEPSTDNQETDTGPAGTFYPLPSSRLDALEAELAADALAAKTAWFAYNGGQLESAPSQEKGKHKKPLFFDIALNYVTLDMDALAARAGKAPTAPQGSSSAAAKSKNVPTSAAGASSKVSASLGVPGHEKKTAEEERAATPEPEPAKSGGGGLGGLLGGWWGRK